MEELNSALEKVNSLKVDLANLEEFGIKEEEFSQIFKTKPVFTLTEFGDFL